MTEQELRNYYQTREFKENCLYDGHDLGASCGGAETVFKLWSPVADSVVLHLYPDGGDGACIKSIPLSKEEKGVWVYRTEENLHGTYYDYQLSICGITRISSDPYARACGVNGLRSMVVDLKTTDPSGWELDQAPEKQAENIVYEVHVKEFSWDESGGFPEECRGKYSAFTKEGTTLYHDGVHPTGISYLKELGVTHVQLLPVYDYGSVDEAGNPDQFNWGYDPVCYNVPEGSYSSDPYHGEVRIKELKELVQSLHQHGIRVIMDVVYNHTYNADSNFGRTVPGYYYREWKDGSLSNGSACGNDFASERKMAGDFILDSVLYWLEEYHMDGFRFDLMGLLDTTLMNRIGETLAERYGEGEKLVYGEPWAADKTAMEEGFTQALKANEEKLDLRIGMFCDDTRDAIKGHVFEAASPGFVNGMDRLEEKILHSVSGWTDPDGDFHCRGAARMVQYVSAHDNLTLWDKMILTMAPDNGFFKKQEAVLRAYRLAVSIYFTCQGHLFFLSGEEFARTKEGIDNSFQSPIELNRLDYERACEFEELVQFYKDLIALRKVLPGLCDKSLEAPGRITDKKVVQKGVVRFYVDNRGGASPWTTLFIAYNNSGQPVELPLNQGSWEILLKDGDSSLWRKETPDTVENSVIIDPVSAVILGKIQNME